MVDLQRRCFPSHCELYLQYDQGQEDSERISQDQCVKVLDEGEIPKSKVNQIATVPEFLSLSDISLFIS